MGDTQPVVANRLGRVNFINSQLMQVLTFLDQRLREVEHWPTQLKVGSTC